MAINHWEGEDQRYVDLLSMTQQSKLRELDSVPACFTLAGMLSDQGVHLEATQISHITWGVHRGIANLKQ